MFRFFIHSVVFIIVFLNTERAWGQWKSKTPRSAIGAGGGSAHYFGDLATGHYALYSNIRWNVTLSYQYQVTPRIATRVGVSYIRLFGNDATYGWSLADTKLAQQRLRNLHFRNDLTELSAVVIYTPIPLEDRVLRYRKRQWSLYIGVGVGFMKHNPKARGSIQDKQNGFVLKDNGQLQPWVSLEPQGNNMKMQDASIVNYSTSGFVFPLIVGIKTRLNAHWVISAEAGLRFTGTDYLDDVSSSVYNQGEISYRGDEDYDALTAKPRQQEFVKAMGSTDPNVLPSTSHSLAGIRTQTRGLNGKDSYLISQVTLNYTFGKRVKCPPIK